MDQSAETKSIVIVLNKKKKELTNVGFGDNMSTFPILLHDKEIDIKAIIDYDEEV